ncbi:unnamed protein product [Bursaphelenchus xylophilus]|uniref:(pine wood nematode) hypothetical protein n=1 Tax=Bursaphelenchus xylophilus TaxID=6326 RepID=A0A1I7S409_BURXY|nr:unnamed protein product [Bursaphelenchus xylophilus]CAG9116612.1 unnamed protein product [Bursaphelenchus xylophilus]
MNAEQTLEAILSLITIVFQDLQSRYSSHDIEATFRYRNYDAVEGGRVFYEKPARLTFNEDEIETIWKDREIMFRTTNTKDLQSHGYFFSHLGKREIFKVDKEFYTVTLEGKRLVDMAVIDEATVENDYPFVTDGIQIIMQASNTTIRSPVNANMQRKICPKLEGKLLGFDEKTSSVILNNENKVQMAGIYDRCTLRELDADINKIEMYVSNGDELDLESQWYLLSHFALLDKEIAQKFSSIDGSMIQFKAIPRHMDTKLCHDLTKYQQMIILYLIIVQIVMHVCFVSMVVFVFVVLLYNFWIYKLLKKMSIFAKKREAQAKDTAARKEMENESGCE